MEGEFSAWGALAILLGALALVAMSDSGSPAYGGREKSLLARMLSGFIDLAGMVMAVWRRKERVEQKPQSFAELLAREEKPEEPEPPEDGHFDVTLKKDGTVRRNRHPDAQLQLTSGKTGKDGKPDRFDAKI